MSLEINDTLAATTTSLSELDASHGGPAGATSEKEQSDADMTPAPTQPQTQEQSRDGSVVASGSTERAQTPAELAEQEEQDRLMALSLAAPPCRKAARNAQASGRMVVEPFKAAVKGNTKGKGKAKARGRSTSEPRTSPDDDIESEPRAKEDPPTPSRRRKAPSSTSTVTGTPPKRRKQQPPAAKASPRRVTKANGNSPSRPSSASRLALGSSQGVKPASPRKPLGDRPSSLSLIDFSNDRAGARQPESEEQRATGWNLNAMDECVFVKVPNVEVWWPAKITSYLRSEKPLKLSLLVGSEGGPTSLKSGNDTLDLTLETPSPSNILSLRSSTAGGTLRFTVDTFDCETAENPPAEALPSKGDFEAALQEALRVDGSRSDSDDDDDDDLKSLDDLLRLPSTSASARTPATTQPTSSAAERDEYNYDDDDEEEEADPLLQDVSSDQEEELTFPVNCIATSQGRAQFKGKYWPARVLSSHKGKPPRARPRKGQPVRDVTIYEVEFFDSEKQKRLRGDFLLPHEQGFFDVPMGDHSNKDIQAFAKEMVESIDDVDELLRRVIAEDYAPAQEFNDQFFRGGRSRRALADRGKYGAIDDEMVEDIRAELASRYVENPEIDMQEQRYSELTGRDQNEYVISVLAPHAIVFLSLKLDEDFRGNVEAKMPKDADKMSPEEQDQRRHDLALEEIDRQTLIKWYQTLISTRQVAASTQHARRRGGQLASIVQPAGDLD